MIINGGFSNIPKDNNYDGSVLDHITYVPINPDVFVVICKNMYL